MANSLSISDDQNEIDNFKFDSIQTDISKMNSNLSEFNSSVDKLNNNIENYQSTLSKVSNHIVSGVKQIGGIGAQMAKNAHQEFGPDIKGSGFERGMVAAAGPIGIAVAKSIQNTGLGDAIKGIGSKVMSMFGRKQDSGMIDPSSIRDLASSTANEAKAIVNSVSNLKTPVTQLAQYQKENNDIAKQQLSHMKEADKKASENAQKFQEAIIPLLQPVNQTLVRINESISKLNNAFTDPSAPKGGLLSTFWEMGKMMMGLRFINATRYGGDIPKSKNPLETISNALIKTYEWTRLYGELSRRQLNELIKYPSGGGRPQKVIGAESVMTALLRKGTERLKQTITSSMGEDSFIGKALNKVIGLAANFAVGETEDAKDAEYAKAMSKWTQFIDDHRKGVGFWQKIQDAGAGANKRFSGSDEQSAKALDDMASGRTQAEIDANAEKRSKDTTNKLIEILKQDVELKNTIQQATAQLTALKQVSEQEKNNKNIQEQYAKDVNYWQNEISKAVAILSEKNNISSSSLDIKSITELVDKTSDSLFGTAWDPIKENTIVLDELDENVLKLINSLDDNSITLTELAKSLGLSKVNKSLKESVVKLSDAGQINIDASKSKIKVGKIQESESTGLSDEAVKVLEALGEQPMTASEIAKSAGYKRKNKTVDTILNQLVEGGYIGSVAGGKQLKYYKMPQNDIPQMAKGGVVDEATTAVVGEKGPEAVIPVDKLLNTIKDTVKTFYESFKQDSQLKMMYVSESIKSAFSSLKETTVDSASGLKETIKTDLYYVGQVTKESLGKVYQGTVNIGHGIQNKIEQTKELTKELAVSAKETAIKLAKTGQEKLSDLAKYAEKTLNLQEESNVMQQQSLQIEIAQETDRLYEKIKNAGKKVQNAGKGLLDTILHNPMISSLAVCLGILAKFPAISEWVFSSPSTFLKAIQMWHKIKKLMTSLFKTLLTNPKKVFGAIKTGLNLYVKGLQKITNGLLKLPKVLSKGYKSFLTWINKLPGAIKSLFSGKSKLMKDIMTSIKSGFTKMINMVKNIWSGGFTKFIKDIGKWSKNLGSKIATNFKHIVSVIKGNVVKFVTDIGGIAAKASQKAKTIFTGLKDLFKRVPNLLVAWKNYLKDVPSLGKKIVSGIATVNVGFKHMISGLKNIGKSASVAADSGKHLKNIPKVINAIKHPVSAISGLAKFIGSAFKGIGSVAKAGGAAAKGMSAAAKIGTKAASAGAVKSFKLIPGLGSIISILFAINRFRKGQWFTGILEFASGITSMIPGIGTGISLVLDAITIMSDMVRDSDMSTPQKVAEVKQGAGKGWLRNLPGLGTIVGLFDSLRLFKAGEWGSGFYHAGRAISTIVPFGGYIFDGISSLVQLITEVGMGQQTDKGESQFGVMGGIIRQIPIIGSAFSIMSAIKRFKNGEIFTGILEAASGIASLFPGVGTIISSVLTGITFFVDRVANEGDVLSNKEDMSSVKEGLGDGWLRNLPLIGPIMNLWDSIKLFKNGEILHGVRGLGRAIVGIIPGGGWLFDTVEGIVNWVIGNPPSEEKQKESAEIVAGLGEGWLRNLPLIGPIVNLWDSIKLFKNGEVLGGLKGLGRAVVGIIPGGGWLFDKVTGFVEWIMGNGDERSVEEKAEDSKEIRENMGSGVLRNIPVIGSIVNLWDSIKLFRNGDWKGGLKGVGRAVAGIIPGGGWLFDKVSAFAEWFLGTDSAEGGEDGLGLMGKQTSELTFLDKVKLLWDGGKRIISSQDAESAMGIKMWRQAGAPDWWGKWMWNITHPIAAITGGFSKVNDLSKMDTKELKDAVTESAKKVKEGKDLLWSGIDGQQIQGIAKLKEAGWSTWQVRLLWSLYHPIDATLGRWENRNAMASAYSSMSDADKKKFNDSVTEKAQLVKEGKDLLWDGNEDKQGLGIAKLRKAGWSNMKISALWHLYHPLAALTGGWFRANAKAPNLNNLSKEDAKKYEDLVTKKAEIQNEAMKLLKSGKDSEQSRGIYMLKKQGMSYNEIQAIWKWYHPIDYTWGLIKKVYSGKNKFDELWSKAYEEAVKHHNQKIAEIVAKERAEKLQALVQENAKIQAARFAEIDTKNKNLQERAKTIAKAKVWMQSNNINDQAKAVGMLRRAKWSFNDIKQLWLSYHPEIDAMGEITPSGLKRWDEIYKMSDIHAQNKKQRKKNTLEAIYKARKLFSEGNESKAREAIALLKKVGVSDENIQKIYEQINPNAAMSAQFKSMLVDEQLSKTRTRSGTFDIKTKKDDKGNIVSYSVGDQTYSANSAEGQRLAKIAEAQKKGVSKAIDDKRRQQIYKNVSNSITLEASASSNGQKATNQRKGVNFSKLDKNWLNEIAGLIRQLGSGNDKEIRQKIANLTGGAYSTVYGGDGPLKDMPSNHFMQALLDYPAGHGSTKEENLAAEKDLGIKSFGTQDTITSARAKEIADTLVDPTKSPITNLEKIIEYQQGDKKWGSRDKVWSHLKEDFEKGIADYNINNLQEGKPVSSYAISPQMMSEIHADASASADNAAFGHLSESQQKAYQEKITSTDDKGNTVTQTASQLYAEDQKASDLSNDQIRQNSAHRSLVSTLKPDILNYYKRAGKDGSNVADSIISTLSNATSNSNHFTDLASLITQAEARNIVSKIKKIYTTGSTALWTPSHWDKAIASKYEDSIKGIAYWGGALDDAKKTGKYNTDANKSIEDSANTVNIEGKDLKLSGEVTTVELQSDAVKKEQQNWNDIENSGYEAQVLFNKSHGLPPPPKPKSNAAPSTVTQQAKTAANDMKSNTSSNNTAPSTVTQQAKTASNDMKSKTPSNNIASSATKSESGIEYDEFGEITSVSATAINKIMREKAQKGSYISPSVAIHELLKNTKEFKALDPSERRDLINTLEARYRSGSLKGESPIKQSDLLPKELSDNIAESTRSMQQDTVETSVKNDVDSRAAGNKEMNRSVKEAGNKQVNAINRTNANISNSTVNNNNSNTTVNNGSPEAFYMNTTGTNANAL